MPSLQGGLDVASYLHYTDLVIRKANGRPASNRSARRELEAIRLALQAEGFQVQESEPASLRVTIAGDGTPRS